MARSIAERWNMNYRRLHFGEFVLVPVADRDWYPYDQPWCADKWHVPGRITMSTDELVALADRQDITVKLVEHDGVNITTTQLN